LHAWRYYATVLPQPNNRRKPYMNVSLIGRSSFLLIVTAFLWASSICAADPDSLSREGALRVYLDGLSDDYYKDNLTFVN